MLKYTLKRILMLIPTIIGITLFIYLIMSFVPGDPVELILPQEATYEQKEALRAEMGLDQPVLVQYANYMHHSESTSMTIYYLYVLDLHQVCFLRRSHLSNQGWSVVPGTSSLGTYHAILKAMHDMTLENLLQKANLV